MTSEVNSERVNGPESFGNRNFFPCYATRLKLLTSNDVSTRTINIRKLNLGISIKSSRIHAIKFSYNFVSRISLVPYLSLLFVSLQEKERRETLETTLMQSQLRSRSVILKTLVDDLLVSQKNNLGKKGPNSEYFQ